MTLEVPTPVFFQLGGRPSATTLYSPDVAMGGLMPFEPGGARELKIGSPPKDYDGLELTLYWPPGLGSGLSSILLFESPYRYDQSGGILTMESFEPTPEKGDTELPLATINVRRKGSDFTAEAELGSFPNEVTFYGTTIDLKIKVVRWDMNPAHAAEPGEKVFFLRNLPIIAPLEVTEEGDRDEVGHYGDPRAEGYEYELAAKSLYVPAAAVKDEPNWSPWKLTEKEQAAAGVKVGSSVGVGSSLGVAHLNRVTNVLRFYGRLKDSPAQLLTDRWVFDLSWIWISRGESVFYNFAPSLLRLSTSSRGGLREEYSPKFEVVPTTRPGKILAGLRGPKRNGKRGTGPPVPTSDYAWPIPKGKRAFVRDIIIKGVGRRKPREHTYPRRVDYEPRALWLLPFGFDPRRDEVRLSECERLAPGAHVRPRRWQGTYVFPLRDPWQRYHYLLKQILERLALVEANQLEYAKFYTANQDELDTFSNVVAPIEQAFRDVQFKVRGPYATMTFEPGTLREYSTLPGSRYEKGAALHHDHENRIHAGATLGKLRKLRRFEDSAAKHLQVAFSIFTSPEFRAFYDTTQFLEEDRQVLVGEKTAETLDLAHGLPSVKDDDRGWIQPVTLPYDKHLKLFILNQFAIRFPIMANPPLPPQRHSPPDEVKKTAADLVKAAAQAAADRDEVLAKAQAAQRERREQFELHVGRRFEELHQAYLFNQAVEAKNGEARKRHFEELLELRYYWAKRDAEDRRSRGEEVELPEKTAWETANRKKLEQAWGDEAGGLARTFIGMPAKFDVFESLTGGGMALMLQGGQRLEAMSEIVLGERKAWLRLTKEDLGRIEQHVRDGLGTSAEAKRLGIMQFTMGTFSLFHKTLTSWDKMFGEKPDGAREWLKRGVDVADMVLSVVEVPLKVATMRVGVKLKLSGKDFTIVEVEAPRADKAGKAVGKALQFIGLASAILDLAEMVSLQDDGFDVDDTKLVLKVLEIVAILISFTGPVGAFIGGILGTLVMVISTFYDALREGEMEAPTTWWFKTPWGYNPFRDGGEGIMGLGIYEVISHKEPEKILKLFVEKFDPFFNQIGIAYNKKSLDEAEPLGQLYRYLDRYLSSNCKRLEMVYEDRSEWRDKKRGIPRRIKFSVYDDAAAMKAAQEQRAREEQQRKEQQERFNNLPGLGS